MQLWYDAVTNLYPRYHTTVWPTTSPPRLSWAVRIQQQRHDKPAYVSNLCETAEEKTYPYRPRTSEKININTIPTNTLDWFMYARTPCNRVRPQYGLSRLTELGH